MFCSQPPFLNMGLKRKTSPTKVDRISTVIGMSTAATTTTADAGSATPSTTPTTIPSTSVSEENQTILGFKAICNFVRALNEVFGDRQLSLQLYAHLLEKTGIVHEEPIRKHLSTFQHFLKANERCIVERTLPLVFGEIRYSERVNIDLQKIFQWAAKDEQEVIWKHLLTISAIVDPTGPAKEILRNLRQGDTKEEDFLANLLKKVMDNVNLNAQNPMEMVSSLLSSGALNDIMGSMNDNLGEGGMDFQKLLQTIQTMMSTFGSMMNENPNFNVPPFRPGGASPPAPVRATRPARPEPLQYVDTDAGADEVQEEGVVSMPVEKQG